MNSQYTGRLIYLMGPSGSGKDSLLNAVREKQDDYAKQDQYARQDQYEKQKKKLHIAKRHITRKASENSFDEAHKPLSEEAFLQALAQGEYAMHWQSHGLYYGIHKEIESLLEEGGLVIVNGSRAYLPKALARYPALIPLLISVKTEVLQARLEARGRESKEDIAKRLERANMDMTELKALPQLEIIDNSARLEEACAAFIQCINKYI